jgi:hypothetical protein
MPAYRVVGNAWVEETCDCEHCEGHSVIVGCDKVVTASDSSEAASKALRQFAHERGAEHYGWRKGSPEVTELGEEVCMRMLGAPMLPGLKEG